MVAGELVMLAQVETTLREPGYFVPLIMGMFVLGGVVSLIAAVLGSARARAFGPSARWFSFSAICLVLFHIQFLVMGVGMFTRDNDLVYSIMAVFNLFIILAAICAAIGFIRLTNPR